jgi:sugar-specific transcriptional regulator TrmB
MIEELKKLGLTEYEIRVYETLLKLGTAKGGEIFRKSGVPHGKTYVALIQLADKGLITVLPLKPKQFKVTDPKMAIKILIEKKMQELISYEKILSTSIKTIKTEEKEEAKGKLEIVAGFEESFEYFHKMSITAKKELLLISKGEKVPYKTYVDVKRLVSSGVDFKFIIFEFDGNRDLIKTFVDLGANVRYYPAGEISFIIKDREECLIAVRNPRDTKDRVNIYLKDKAISNALAEYFYVIWGKAKPVKF